MDCVRKRRLLLRGDMSMAAIGICPTVDFAFKLLLGSPDHSRVTIHFLNAILAGQTRITKVQILNPFIPKETEDDKLAILDILATDEHGRLLNIEMQTSLPAELPQRLAYYASSLYVGQLSESVNYSELRPAITICVLTQSMFRQRPELHLDFRLRDDAGTQLTDNLQIHLLELPKLNVTAQNVGKSTAAEQWAYFLLNAEHLTTEEIRQQLPAPEFAEAAGVLSMISRTPENRMLYDARLKFQRDEESRLRRARQEGRSEGIEEGLQLGLEKGLEKGIEKGIEKGAIAGRIILLQQLLNLPQATIPELTVRELTELVGLEEQLQHQLRSGRS